MPITVQKRDYGAKIRNYVFVMVILMAVVGIYGVMQYQKLADARGALDNGQIYLNTLTSTKNKLTASYPSQKKRFDEKFAGDLKALKDVYPPEENYTKLAIAFDQLFKDLNRSGNPAFLGNLRFSQSQTSPDKDYAILQVNMDFSGTQDNFDKFLNFIENSGNLADGTRLMSVNSINITFPGAAGEGSQTGAQPLAPEKQLVNANFSLNAYFQAPVR